MKRILLIDDDPDEAEIFKEAVAAVDHTTIFDYISNCVDALKAFRQQLQPVPNFIFLDINMPVLNGFECLKQLKLADFLKHIPVIMYSTSSRLNDVNEAMTLGALDFWTKPNGYRDLIKKLQNLIHSAITP
jgi:CheY-like chemotaxis protein